MNVYRAYDDMPEEPKRDLPKEFGEIPDSQLALCQAIYDECEDRRNHIEKKSLWTFTAITFLVPILISFVVYLFQGEEAAITDHPLSITPFILSGILLFSSFISAMRALTIRKRQGLYIKSVICEKSGKLKNYDKKIHAKGLLYCAIRNTATNDHIAQFVKFSHQLLLGATMFFVLGAVLIVFGVESPIGAV